MGMDISLARIEHHLGTLVETIGHRVAGSIEHQRAIDYIVGRLREWGVETRLHRIPRSGSERWTVTLRWTCTTPSSTT